ncbi:hypothetical protein [Streptosporangium roseum]|uniref:hypothetical protein n=1 Tax=Streptosporangium roseum TaxID=2001 RepID=UPI003319D3BB
MPTAPEVPRPVQADPDTTNVFESPGTPAAEAPPPYPVPGGTPAYPGWESASETPASGGRDDRDGTDVPPGAAQPSRYDPPTSPEGFPAASHRQPEQPEQAGPPEQPGRFEQAGPPEQDRPSEQPGRFEQPGRPEQAGPPEQPVGGFQAEPPAGPGGPYGGPAAPYGGPSAPYGGPSAPYGEAAPGAHRGPGDEAPTEHISGAGPYGTPPYTGAHASRPDEPSQQPPYAPPAGGPSYPSYPSDGPPQGGLSYPSGQPYQAAPPGGAYPGGPGYPGGTPYPAYPGDDRSRQQGGGLGTTALVLGIVSLFLLVVCGLGALTAIIGLIIGIAAVVKNSNRGRAWVGIALSVLTLIIAVVVLSWFYSKVGDCLNLPPEFQQRCIQEKFGGQFTTS